MPHIFIQSLSPGTSVIACTPTSLLHTEMRQPDLPFVFLSSGLCCCECLTRLICCCYKCYHLGGNYHTEPILHMLRGSGTCFNWQDGLMTVFDKDHYLCVYTHTYTLETEAWQRWSWRERTCNKIANIFLT